MRLIDPTEVCELHSEAVRLYGGLGTIPSNAVDCVEGTIGNAMLAEHYVTDDERIRPGLCFAGFLLFYLVRDHCFTDGNKRVGWMSAMRILGDIGLTVDATQEQAEAFMDEVSTGHTNDGRQVVKWLAEQLAAPPT